MIRQMLQGKIHRAAVSETRLEYPGSLTVDIELLELAGILPHQKIQLVNCNNGTRLETYVIVGERGKRELIVNGAAARLAQKGDRVIVIAYADFDEQEVIDHHPTVVVCDEHNNVVEQL